FQAEAGIRDFHVTGVQTCALPISSTSYTASRTSADAATSYVITACRANGFGDTTAGAAEVAAAKKSAPSTVASNVAPPPAMAVGAETWIVKRAVSQASSG